MPTTERLHTATGNSTMPLLRHLLLLSCLCLPLAMTAPARAAEGFDGCDGHYIDTLPATITTQGTWCLRHDLNTAIVSGPAIDIQTNNVTLDCNDFKLGGLAAGDGSVATGIYAADRQNIRVTHCNVRGFYRGIWLRGETRGHQIDGNRLEANLYGGIIVTGYDNTVVGNAVFDTGGSTKSNAPIAIDAGGDVIDNTIAGVWVNASYAVGNVIGIRIFATGTLARGNRITGLVRNGTGYAQGINAIGSNNSVRDNVIGAPLAATNGAGIGGNGSSSTFCGGNTITNFAVAVGGCQDTGGNYSH